MKQIIANFYNSIVIGEQFRVAFYNWPRGIAWNFAERETRLSPDMATWDLNGQSVEIGNFLSDPQKGGPPVGRLVII